MLLDLDRSKEINDTLGHHVGDLLRRQGARRLADRLSRSVGRGRRRHPTTAGLLRWHHPERGPRAGIAGHPDAAAIVQSVIDLAGRGCDLAQGHLLSKPVPADLAGELLRAWSRRPTRVGATQDFGV